MYRPRNPRASPLWQCVQRHGKELREAGRLQRAVEERAIERFIECGDPHHGFARIYCDACGHDYLLAFSCKARYFCPSCHQKRVLLYGEWVEENVLAPVPHRQYVFTLPRLVRHFFARRREWLGELCRIAERLLSLAYAQALPAGRPALIVFVQTFGDLVNFNPHLHVLAADRARGERAKKASPQGHVVLPSPNEEAANELAARAKAAWARLIRKVYEADPLECPKCNGPMRVIALIEDPGVIRRILEHLGLWAPLATERSPPLGAASWPRHVSLPLTYHPVPDIA